MAMTLSTNTILVIVTLLSVLSTTSYGRVNVMVGGKTEVADVRANREVQELGRFAVEEYNQQRLRMRRDDGGDETLRFVEVVEAEQQVVSGVKYYLKISAATRDGVHRMFTSVVVVKPWLHSKKILHFGPLSSFQQQDI